MTEELKNLKENFRGCNENITSQIELMESMGLFNPIEYQSSRATGRSTKIVDFLVQRLFTTGEVVLIDHDISNLAVMQKYVKYTIEDKMLRRLYGEHRDLGIINKELCCGFPYIQLKDKNLIKPEFKNIKDTLNK